MEMFSFYMNYISDTFVNKKGFFVYKKGIKLYFHESIKLSMVYGSYFLVKNTTTNI